LPRRSLIKSAVGGRGDQASTLTRALLVDGRDAVSVHRACVYDSYKCRGAALTHPCPPFRQTRSNKSSVMSSELTQVIDYGKGM